MLAGINPIFCLRWYKTKLARKKAKKNFPIFVLWFRNIFITPLSTLKTNIYIKDDSISPCVHKDSVAMIESRVNIEPDDTMIRITTRDLTQPAEDIGFVSRQRRRNGNSPVGTLRNLFGCIPIIPIFWPSYRRKKSKLISDPRLRHILNRINISIILKAESSTTSLTQTKNNTKSSNPSICSDTGSSSNSVDSDQDTLLNDNKDNDTDEEDEDLQKISIVPQQEKGGLLRKSPTFVTTDNKNSVCALSRESNRCLKKW